MVKRSHTIHQISIHAPTRGATVYEMTGYLTPEDFNPRSYKRSDYDGYHRALHPQISIHAPTRGATVNPKHYIGCTYFNPRSYKRSDCCFHKFFVSHKYFNPRSYKRSDSPISLRQWTDWNFNPRSYKRSDQSEAKPYEINKISIHAPTRGATTLCSQMSSSSS